MLCTGHCVRIQTQLESSFVPFASSNDCWYGYTGQIPPQYISGNAGLNSFHRSAESLSSASPGYTLVVVQAGRVALAPGPLCSRTAGHRCLACGHCTHVHLLLTSCTPVSRPLPLAAPPSSAVSIGRAPGCPCGLANRLSGHPEVGPPSIKPY